jgi:hypothetical protein
MPKKMVIGRRIVRVQFFEWTTSSTREKYDAFKSFTVHGMPLEKVVALCKEALQVQGT